MSLFYAVLCLQNLTQGTRTFNKPLGANIQENIYQACLPICLPAYLSIFYQPKAVVGGTAGPAMAGPLFGPKMVLAGPLFRPIIYIFFLPGNFSADQILNNNIDN